jgi:Fic family protein
MNAKENFEFLNSELWIKYTHENYLALDEIKHRLENEQLRHDWASIRARILTNRKTGAIPLFLESIDKKFWFFPADCILRKAHEIEKIGQELHDLISHASFQKDFYLDSTIEEAISSAIYEGANSTRAKAQQLIAAKARPKNKDEWMLLNNFEAMQWIKRSSANDVSLELIRNVHEIVTRNTLEAEDLDFAGKFRNDQVFVHSKTFEVKHEGIPHDKIIGALTEAIELTTKNSRYFPAILKGVLLHYFIAYIHPLFDGNGRTARTLFYFKAIKNKLNFVELLSVSAYLKNHGRRYERSFEKVIDHDLDITYFIDFNLDALMKAIEKVRTKVEFLLKVPNLKLIYKLSDFQIGLLQKTVLHPFSKTDAEGYASTISRSREIARQELKQLKDLGFMKEAKDGKRFVYMIDRKKLIDEVNKAKSSV